MRTALLVVSALLVGFAAGDPRDKPMPKDPTPSVVWIHDETDAGPGLRGDDRDEYTWMYRTLDGAWGRASVPAKGYTEAKLKAAIKKAIISGRRRTWATWQRKTGLLYLD